MLLKNKHEEQNELCGSFFVVIKMHIFNRKNLNIFCFVYIFQLFKDCVYGFFILLDLWVFFGLSIFLLFILFIHCVGLVHVVSGSEIAKASQVSLEVFFY